MKHIKTINEFHYYEHDLDPDRFHTTSTDKREIVFGIIRDTREKQGYTSRVLMAPIEMIEKMYNVHVVSKDLGSEDELYDILDELEDSNRVEKLEVNGKIGYKLVR